MTFKVYIRFAQVDAEYYVDADSATEAVEIGKSRFIEENQIRKSYEGFVNAFV